MCAGGKGGGYGNGGMIVQSMGEMGKDFCRNFLQSFLDNIDRRGCNDGSRQLIPVFYNRHRKSPCYLNDLDLLIIKLKALPMLSHTLANKF